MGKRVNKYREVKTLPKKALSIHEYADQRDVTKEAVYNQWRRHQEKGTSVDFEIILFKETVFILPPKGFNKKKNKKHEKLFRRSDTRFTIYGHKQSSGDNILRRQKHISLLYCIGHPPKEAYCQNMRLHPGRSKTGRRYCYRHYRNRLF